MFGRLGTVAGAIAVASLIDSHCELVFYLSGASLIGESNDFILISLKNNGKKLYLHRCKHIDILYSQVKAIHLIVFVFI